jgi:6-phosphofructo-2-kinase/fructose-2,6-biphosphatase 2
LVTENVHEVKVSSPDYLGFDPQEAVDDFMQRIKHYEDGYETITAEENISFVKTINVGTQFVINKITGYLPSRVVYFLMNLNISATSIYLSRHGESVFNERGLIGCFQLSNSNQVEIRN